ncbi:MAG: 1-acyl-sn-glycerol-3-phosphate acyltransferase [Arcanobacterium sp.]
MSLKKIVSRTFQRFSRWKVVFGEPLPDKAVIIGAPHTSNWDGIFMLIALWDAGCDMKFLLKDSVINGPLGPIARAVGGVGVDRNSSNGLVADIVEYAKKADKFHLVIAPKGTRSRREYWKSGFYHIAREAGLPVVLGYIDRDKMIYGWAHSIELTGDVRADMDVIRKFYAGKKGMRPELSCEPRLRMEDDVN